MRARHSAAQGRASSGGGTAVEPMRPPATTLPADLRLKRKCGGCCVEGRQMHVRHAVALMP